jgi:hypothetical protein
MQRIRNQSFEIIREYAAALVTGAIEVSGLRCQEIPAGFIERDGSLR